MSKVHGQALEARQRHGVEAAVAEAAEPAGTLGDQHVAVRQPDHAPGVAQPLRDDRDADVRAAAFIGREFPGPVAERLAGGARLGHNPCRGQKAGSRGDACESRDRACHLRPVPRHVRRTGGGWPG